MKPYNIIISGGGTGGHIYPAIAIANECRKRWNDCNILFVGAADRMEMQKVPAAGYQIKGLWISGLQRNLSLKNLAFPLKLIKSLFDARKIVKQFSPDVAIGTGGYASGPLLFAASSKQIPTLIQEQNSYPGVTNKLLGKKADIICVASEGMDQFFSKAKIRFTGNPVRQDILAVDELREESLKYFDLDPKRRTLLVLGGSLGAKRINELIDEELENLSADVQVLWQCGKSYYSKFKQLASDGVQVLEYIERMDLAYAAADYIISRAGAGSISELCIVGKPSILIPSPHVAENHQVKNAERIAQQDAALMIEEDNLGALFPSAWRKLHGNHSLQDRLAFNIKNLALPRATTEIVDLVEKVIK
ncbi:MAG: undecaprenyldiphospho-muramoylpentapeptide beta-N-acetylglucosaminyltransferase [Nonlabens sp.]